MKKLFALLSLMLCMNVASAASAPQSLDVSGLTAAQVAELQQTIAAQKSTPINTAVAVREEVGAWGEMGAGMAKALVAAAKELGVAANDFSKTDLGKVIVAVVVFKLLGGAVMHILVGTAVAVVSLVVGWLLLNRYTFKCTYEYKPVLCGLFLRKKCVSRYPVNEGTGGWFIALMIVGCFIGVLIVMTF